MSTGPVPDRTSGDVTQILKAAATGDRQAGDKLLPLIYDDLRRLAAAKLARERPGQTLQPTALVHEAWIRIGRDCDREWNGRTHFYAAAAEAMRRILIDNARRRNALRHGGDLQRRDIDDSLLAIAAPDDNADELIDVHEALDRFAALDPRKAELVKLRYFVGLTIEEAAGLLNISEPTAKRWWAFARAWLYRDIASD